MNHPVVVYVARDNLEVHFVCDLLIDQGIEAAAVDDESRAGIWELGLLPNIHKPQVWVDQADFERARLLVTEYDRQRAAQQQTGDDQAPVDAECEECGVTSSYPASRWGFTEVCPKCGAFVDVGDDAIEGWDATPESAD